MIITIAIQSKIISGTFLSLLLNSLNREPIITISPIVFITSTTLLIDLMCDYEFHSGVVNLDFAKSPQHRLTEKKRCFLITDY